MPSHEIDLAILLRNLDDDQFIAEGLLYPEVSRYGSDPEKLEKAVIKNAVRIIETETLTRLWSRMCPTQIDTLELSVHLDPPPMRRLAWREPIELRLDVVRWSQGDSIHIAFIPVLGIEVVSSKLADLNVNSGAHDGQTSMLQRHVHAELQRRGALADLMSLLLLDRTRGLSVVRVPCLLEIRTPKQMVASAGQIQKKKSTLEETALDLTKQQLSPAFEVERAVTDLAESLIGPASSSVLLVGKAGVGKTAIIHELVRRRADFGLGSTPFWATSGARLVAGMSGYGMWQERCDALWQEAQKTNSIIHFGNLVELMDTGKSEHDTQGLASFFRQRFARGPALAILECTPEQLPLIEREDPGILRVFRQLTVAEPSPQASKTILKRYAERFLPEIEVNKGKNKARLASLRRASKPTISEDGLEVLDRLHRRFAGYSAYPARPLRFLRGLMQNRSIVSQESPSIGISEVIAGFARETGLPLFLLDDQVEFDASHTARWFEERVIGQSAAVSLIVELLATVKAGLTRPRRPVASLLFAGPTGVGKTEMAKSVARFFFGDEGRMARFDMSEYADALAVTRLVGGVTRGEGTLTARIREQPFSVLLFDEFEKAHLSFFDLLLQTLGDGRLTDGGGRVADFTNSIVVMTTNLGAERFRRSRAGFGPGGGSVNEDISSPDRATQIHFNRAVQDFLRPEIFNRIDHVVPFVALDHKTVELITEREVKLVEQRDGLLSRGVELRIKREAVAALARRGYDARYGARPLKRLIERELLLPLAVELNSRPPINKSNRKTMIADVGVEAGHLLVKIIEESKSNASGYDNVSLAAQAERLGELRRRIVRLERSSVVIELRNTIWRLTEIERRNAKASRRARLTTNSAKSGSALLRPWEASALASLPEFASTIAALTKLEQEAATEEDSALLMLYGRELSTTPIEKPSVIHQLETDLNKLLLRLLDQRHAHPHRVTLAVYSENKVALFELARSYYTTAIASRMNVKVAHYTANLPPELIEAEMNAGSQRAKRKKEREKPDEEQPKTIEMFGRKVARLDVNKPEEFLTGASDGTTAIIFGLDGKSAYSKYDSESGLHSFVEGKATHHLFIHTSDADSIDYRPPSLLERRGAISPANFGAVRRTYHRTEGSIEDHLLEKRREWRSDLTESLTAFLELQLQRAAEKLIDE